MKRVLVDQGKSYCRLMLPFVGWAARSGMLERARVGSALSAKRSQQLEKAKGAPEQLHECRHSAVHHAMLSSTSRQLERRSIPKGKVRRASLTSPQLLRRQHEHLSYTLSRTGSSTSNTYSSCSPFPC